MTLTEAFYGFLYSLYGLFATHDFGDVKHVRSFAVSYYGKAECVHHVAHVVSFLCNPSQDNLFGGMRLHGGERAQYLYQLGHAGAHAFVPALAHRFLFVLGGRFEEECRLLPQLVDKADAALYQPYDAGEFLYLAVVVLFAVLRQIYLGTLAVAAFLDVLVVEPLSFFVVEFGAAFAATVQVEE